MSIKPTIKSLTADLAAMTEEKEQACHLVNQYAQELHDLKTEYALLRKDHQLLKAKLASKPPAITQVRGGETPAPAPKAPVVLTPNVEARPAAIRYMVERLLANNEGEFVNPQWLADFTGKAWTQVSALTVKMVVIDHTLKFSVPHEVYVTDKSKWLGVINTVKAACEDTDLAAMPCRQGFLPIVVR